MDEFDRATEEEERFVTEAIRNASRGRVQQQLPDGECKTCGLDVEPKRYAAGYAYCMACQTAWEARSKMFRTGG
jgi:RNA polymerase-binding transcription factor DksA